MHTTGYTPASRHPDLWKIRLKLTFQSLKSNWALFRENPVGLVGIGIIVFFGLMALMHPILMATVWPSSVYHPVIGYDRDIVVHPSPPTWIPSASTEIIALNRISPFRHILGTDPLGTGCSKPADVQYAI